MDEDLVARSNARLGALLKGKYTLDRVLGIGGMATVYAATHRNGKEFAVKVLHADLSLRSDTRTRFLRFFRGLVIAYCLCRCYALSSSRARS